MTSSWDSSHATPPSVYRRTNDGQPSGNVELPYSNHKVLIEYKFMIYSSLRYTYIHVCVYVCKLFKFVVIYNKCKHVKLDHPLMKYVIVFGKKIFLACFGNDEI